ncbi:hypothetical protein ACFPTO_03915 [Paraburkholderia denitrificans]|uniref:Uncharacterized protein n=1 Tax=Paraburkholderia denitrificans TaxID=694025 RepID=A0ABW0J4I7_9BURK
MSELEQRLITRFGIKQAQMHAAIKPLFLLMHDHGIGTVSIERDGTKAIVTIDGERL